MEHQETKKKKELCVNAKIQRNKHARKNWKNKLKRRKLEQKGHMAENLEEKDQMDQSCCLVRGTGLSNFSFFNCSSTVNIRREKEKLKELMAKLRGFTKNKRKRGIWSEIVKLGKDVFKACRTGEDLRLKWRSMKVAGEVD
ncbi:hypothetical protein MKW92_032482 [Papaver armeniacum]|nr:hypothetical protein MKW92_032482 [Papaver armeniacum]